MTRPRGINVRLVGANGYAQHTADEIEELLARDDGFVWLDLPRWDDAARPILADTFHLHPLAIADCEERNRVPKMHAYADHVLVVVHAPERGRRGHVHYIELDLVIGHHYLITVHGPVNPAVRAQVAMRETIAVLNRMADDRLRPATPTELAHAIVSALTRNQEDYIEAVTKDVWELEQRATAGQVTNPEEFLDELFHARHGLLAVRTMAALGGALYVRLSELPDASAAGRHMFADTAAKFDRVRSVADGEREYLQGVLEFYQTTLVIKAAIVGQAQNEEVQRLTAASYAQNEEIKKISAWAAIFFAPTLIGTIYGMNFEHMPELHWTLGYPFAFALMAVSSAALYVAFKRRGWL